MGGKRRILVASRNRGKVREIAAVLGALGLELVELDEMDPGRQIAEPSESGETFAANSRAKAEYYARATGLWALADDSGLEVDALGGAPGVHSARYAADECPPGVGRDEIDRANNAKLLRELAAVPDERRTARYVCRLGLSDGRRILLEAGGVMEGLIARQPSGSNGFGYDPLFTVPALGRTVAQLPPRQKNEISHRGLASREFTHRLEELLKLQMEQRPCRK